MTARLLAAIAFLLFPPLAAAQTSQTQGKTDQGRNEAGRLSPSPGKNGNGSDGNGGATPTDQKFDKESDANAITVPSSKPPIAVRGDVPMWPARCRRWRAFAAVR
jgi:hypothetical protein